jgi:hypothetical protein
MDDTEDRPGYARYEELLSGVISLIDQLIRRSTIRSIREERQAVGIPVEFIEEFCQEIRNHLLMNGFDDAVAAQVMRESRRRLLVEDASRSDDDELLDDELVRTATVLGLLWNDLLFMAANGPESKRTIAAAAIGDDMLPRDLDLNQRAAMDEALAQTVVSQDEFRRYLTFIRSAHAQGKAILPEMAEMLALDGIELTTE